MIIAYAILAHARPRQLARLVGALPADSPVLIHFERRAKPELFEEARALIGDRPNTIFVERQVCRWGQIGLVKATMTLVDTLAANCRFDYAVLLSGMDYPLKSNAAIERFFEQNKGREFIESFPLSEPNRWSNMGGHFKAPEKVLKRFVYFRSHAFMLPGIRKPPGGMTVSGGSQWWALSSDAIGYLAKTVRSNGWLMRYFSRSFIPDEAFFQTILANSPFANAIASDLHLIVWDRPQPPYPATLTSQDKELLASTPRLYGRKFDADKDSAVLDWLDQQNRC